MLALLCDACKHPIAEDGYDLTLIPGAVVPSQSPPFRPFSGTAGGTIAATLCVPCGRNVMEFLRQQLRAPAATV